MFELHLCYTFYVLNSLKLLKHCQFFSFLLQFYMKMCLLWILEIVLLCYPVEVAGEPGENARVVGHWFDDVREEP